MSGLVIRNDLDGVATLTLNRPDKLNALSVPVFVELRRHVDDISRSLERISVVVVRGAGKCFSAGHDLSDLVAGEESPHPQFQAQTIQCLADLPQPVIAAKAREMMLTCGVYTGQQARDMGLVNTCVADAQLDSAVWALCNAIQQNSSFSHRANKALLAATDGMALGAGLAYEIYRTDGVGPDMQTRIDAFLSKSMRGKSN